jgi:amicyanin
MKTRHRVHVVMAAAVVAGALSIAAGPLHARQQAGAPVPPAITIDNFKFSPATLEVAAGTKVTWTNRDDVPHVVASVTKKLFVSPVLDTDEAYSFTFKDPGTYEYYCSMHPRMTGKVVVK